MSRTVLTTPLLLAAPLLLCSALFAQSSNITYIPPGSPATIYTPEIHIGSATTPSTVTVPPVVQITSVPSQSRVSNAPPASTELLSERHFDFIVSPIQEAIPGSMEDTSISLGDYARQLRAEKQKSLLPSTPNAIAQPVSPN